MNRARARGLPPLPVLMLLAGLLGASAWAAAPAGGATVLRETTLYAADDFASARLAELAPATRLAVHGRRGLWLEVALPEDDSRRGHVRLTSVRMTGAVPAAAAADGSGLARLSRSLSGLLGGFGRREAPKIYDTLGIRGLTPAELRTAAFDGAALQAIAGAAASPEQARAFAAAGGLAARSVAKLDADAGRTQP